jgi:hypothetical protein
MLIDNQAFRLTSFLFVNYIDCLFLTFNVMFHIFVILHTLFVKIKWLKQLTCMIYTKLCYNMCFNSSKFIISTQTRITFIGLCEEILKTQTNFICFLYFCNKYGRGPSRGVPLEWIQAQVQAWNLNLASQHEVVDQKNV